MDARRGGPLLHRPFQLLLLRLVKGGGNHRSARISGPQALPGKGDEMTGNITRRELRKRLRASNEGKDVETAVARLLAGGQK